MSKRLLWALDQVRLTRLLVDGEDVISRAEMATGLFDRMRGLLGRDGLAAGSGLFLSPCGGIHTWFMRFAIDVFFLDRDGRVVSIARQVRPFRMAFGGRHARSAIEVASGWLEPQRLKQGDRCTFDPL